MHAIQKSNQWKRKKLRLGPLAAGPISVAGLDGVQLGPSLVKIRLAQLEI